MYINMTPDKTNKTLHASQDDTRRQFKFKLINDSQVLDVSDSIPPVIYDVEPNGIEQLLPVNSSTPTTSPIIADIKYPDELREDQEFFERVTPTTIKGKAKIEKIKGNTIVWNQLVQNGNFVDTSIWQNYGSSFTVSGNTATVKTTNASNQFGVFQAITFKANHKYFISFEVKKHGTITLKRNRLSSGQEQIQEGLYRTIETASADSTISTPLRILFGEPVSDIANDYFMVKNYIIIDLTEMGLDSITDSSEFISLSPLPYYDYNVGSLLSFNGTGLKTTGKNLFTSNDTFSRTNNGYYIYDKTIPGNYPIVLYLEKGTYTFSFTSIDSGPAQIEFFNGGTTSGDRYYAPAFNLNSGVTTKTVVLEKDCQYFRMYCNFVTTLSNIQIEFGDTATTYEPYKETTTPLPTSTYFPTGMKSAGTAYDELTPTKATTRIGVVDLGNLDYVYDSTVPRFYTSGLANIVKKPSTSDIKGNAISDMYEVLTVNQFFASAKDKSMMIATNGNISFINTAYSSASAFKSAMSGVYLYYEVATPTEEDIESCSLVSKNVEIPLEYDNGFLVCDSEGLTSKSGFIPCKVKKAKGDETLYSQLINLHVERKP